jgi:hypothetical protein
MAASARSWSAGKGQPPASASGSGSSRALRHGCAYPVALNEKVRPLSARRARKQQNMRINMFETVCTRKAYAF